MQRALYVLFVIGVFAAGAAAQTDEEAGRYDWREPGPRVGHVFPGLTMMAPGVGSRSESAIGAVIPWANRLWAIGYVASGHKRGSGLGLYEIKEDFSFRLHPESVTGTYANRYVHWPSRQVFIGPYAIDASGHVRLIEELAGYRLTATAAHLTNPMKVYFLGMEGDFFEVDAKTLEVKRLANLTKELNLPRGADDHFKGMHTAQGRVIVANNTYKEPEYKGKRHAGRLAAWDGEGEWEILSRHPFMEVSGVPAATGKNHHPVYALGWDDASTILRVLIDGEWRRYRLPRGGHEWSHMYFTEWMRIRQAQTERFLMDAFGIYYRLPRNVYDGAVWGIKPIASHQRVVPDFCYWRGLLVLAGDQIDHDEGQPQSGFWFGGIEDLYQMGKPTGWGAVWREDSVEAGETSDPMLMTGFDQKVVHLAHDQNDTVVFTIEVDPLGDGHWKTYQQVEVGPDGYGYHVFPDGFSAHWVRVRVDTACEATAQFFYN